tara:strand:- start:385 stop:915 length:531 start_codon:yes stop_codon:yes gene_type:complete
MEGIQTGGKKLVIPQTILSRARELVPRALELATYSRRKRYAIPLFQSTNSTQALVNAFRQGTYIPPHCHNDKDEYFQALQGEVAVVTFTYEGNISNIQHLYPGRLYTHVTPGIIHSAVPLSEEAVVLEVLNKPYDLETHKQFPTWSIPENDPRVPEFQKQLLADITQTLKTPSISQ